jgi:hypothetical protein
MSSAVDFGGAGSPTGGPGFVPTTVTTGGAGSGSTAPVQLASTGEGAGSLPLLVAGASDAGSVAAFQALQLVAAAGSVGNPPALISGDLPSGHLADFFGGAAVPFSSVSGTDDAFDLLAWNLNHLHTGWFIA